MTVLDHTPSAGLAALPRLLRPADQPPGLAAHLERHGELPYRGGAGLLLATLDEAALTGRGGAGFPAGRKWRAVAAGRGRAAVVANGAEGEPASSKDRVLLRDNPHLVLDGLQLAAEAVAADQAVLFVQPGADVRATVDAALRERGASDRLPVRVVTARERFLSGEESAVVDALEGGPGLPRSTPPRVFERGLGGRPTLVQNVETLAHVALVARHGSDWFRAVGTDAEPGSLLATVRPVGAPPRVAEVAHGTPLTALLDLSDTQAVLVGGYHGSWLTVADAATAALSRESLGRFGASPGAGALVALPPAACGLVETARVMVYLAGHSAGQCGPCLNGLPRIALAVEALAAGGGRPADLDDLARWSGLVERRGACHHPDGSVRFLRSALTTFADEVDLHLAGRCSATSTARILPVPARRAS